MYIQRYAALNMTAIINWQDPKFKDDMAQNPVQFSVQGEGLIGFRESGLGFGIGLD